MYKVREYYYVKAFEEGIEEQRKLGYVLEDWEISPGEQNTYIAIFKSAKN